MEEVGEADVVQQLKLDFTIIKYTVQMDFTIVTLTTLFTTNNNSHTNNSNNDKNSNIDQDSSNINQNKNTTPSKTSGKRSYHNHKRQVPSTSTVHTVLHNEACI